MCECCVYICFFALDVDEIVGVGLACALVDIVAVYNRYDNCSCGLLCHPFLDEAEVFK